MTKAEKDTYLLTLDKIAQIFRNKDFFELGNNLKYEEWDLLIDIINAFDYESRQLIETLYNQKKPIRDDDDL